MPTLAELLKSAGIAEDVAAGVPKEVAAAIETHLTAADTKFLTASQKEERAAELERLVAQKEVELTNYVATYGSKLVDTSAKDAEIAGLRTALEKLKSDGFNVEIPPVSGKPAEPAKGANAVDEDKLLGKVGLTMGSILNLNNEYARLYGQPLPDDINALYDEAKKNNYTNVLDYASKKYKFAEKREEQSAAKQKEHDDKIRADATAEAERKAAERYGSNPNLRGGEPSRNSMVPKIKSEDFQKSGGPMPTRARQSRLLDNLHKDLAVVKSA
jgi:hypothetical protein